VAILYSKNCVACGSAFLVAFEMLQRLDAQGRNNLSAISVIAPARALSRPAKSVIPLFKAIFIYSVIEFLAVATSAFAAHILYRFVFFQTLDWRLVKVYSLSAIALATLVLLFSLGFRNFNAVRRQARDVFLWKGLGVVALSFSVFLTIIVFMQTADAYSRATLIFQVVCVSATVAISRMAFFSWLRSAIASDRIEARRIVLVGDDAHRGAFSNRLKESGIRTVGSFSAPRRRRVNGKAVNARAQGLVSAIRPLLPDDIIILVERTITSATVNLASALAEIPAGVHVLPFDALHPLASAQVTPFGRLQTIQLYRPPLSTFDLFVKRVFDLVFATVGLIVLSPLFLVISIAIKLETPGPVFFRQKRHGFNNEEIRVLKFRSMVCAQDGGKFKQTVENDPRVTRIGRIMRRTNIDELPQLINVLNGEMSIVGPRPHATDHNDMFANVITPFSRRHNVKPGITGWAQVNGYRGSTDTLRKMQQRIEYDLQYIDNWSFLFDMKIIVMTIFAKRAYLNAY